MLKAAGKGKGPLKGKKSTKSQSDSEAISLPVGIQLKNLANKNLFETIRDEASKNRSESTDTEGVTEGQGQGTSGVRSTGHKSPNIRNESDETPRKDSDQSLDKFTRCFEILTNTISAGFSGLKSDIAELATDHDDYIDEGDSDQSQGSESESDYESLPRHATNSPTVTVNDILAKVKNVSGSINSTSTKEGENESGANLLKVLTKQITAQDLTTDPINNDLAKLVNELMFKEKADKKLAEQVKESAEKIKRPENCDSLVCTRVDELIWSRLQVQTKSMDSRFQQSQLYLIKSVTVLVNLLDKLVSNKDIAKEEMVREMIKAVEMLSFSNYELNMRRRECLKADIDSVNYLSLFSSAVPINQHLFGGDLGKKLDEIEKTNKAVSKVMTGKQQKPRGQRNRRFNPYNKGYRRNNPFLGQGPRRGAYGFNRGKAARGKRKQE